MRTSKLKKSYTNLTFIIISYTFIWIIIFFFWHIPARLKFIGRPHYFTYILLFPVAHNNWPGFNSFLCLHNIDFLQFFHTIKTRNFLFFFFIMWQNRPKFWRKFSFRWFRPIIDTSKLKRNFLKIKYYDTIIKCRQSNYCMIFNLIFFGKKNLSRQIFC